MMVEIKEDDLAKNVHDLPLEAIDKARMAYGAAYEDIIDFIKSYMDMPPEFVKLSAVWILGTYMHECFESYPYLFVNAMRGSGKTRLLKIIANFAKDGNGQVHTGLSESVFFRYPKHCTMVIDEFESVGHKDKQALREYLNASYKKGGIVQRMKKVRDKEGGEGYKAETFEPFKPIAMANIWGMDEVLGDRCISFILEKSNNPGKTKKIENFSDNSFISDVKRTLKAFNVVVCNVMYRKKYIEHWNNYIDSRYNDITTSSTQTTYNYITTSKESKELDLDEMFLKIDEANISGRNFELLFPLLLTARFLNFETFLEILKVGKSILDQKVVDEFNESKDVSLIEFISRLPSDYQLQYKSVNELSNEFKAFMGEGDIDEKWINPKWLGQALKRLDLVTSKKRVTKGQQVTLNISKAKEKLKMFKKEEVSDE